MELTKAAILLLDAIAGGIRRAPGPEGDDRIVAVCEDAMLATNALQTIVDGLDWRLKRIDAARTNLSDLMEDSPLRSEIAFARESDRQYVVVVQSATPALLEDDRYRSLTETMASDLPVVLCMTTPPADAHGWTVVDLRQPG